MGLNWVEFVTAQQIRAFGGQGSKTVKNIIKQLITKGKGQGSDPEAGFLTCLHPGRIMSDATRQFRSSQHVAGTSE